MSGRKIFWISIIVLILLVLGRFLLFSFRLNNIKPVIERELSRIFEAETTISGNITAVILPSFGVNVEGMQLDYGPDLMITARKARAGIPLGTLFSSEVIIKDLNVHGLTVNISNQEDYYEEPDSTYADSTGTIEWKVDLTDINVRDGRVVYIDQHYNDTISFDGILLASDSLIFQGDENNFTFSGVKGKGKLLVRQLNVNDISIDTVRLDVNIINGIIELGQRMEGVNGGLHESRILADLSGSVPSYSIYFQDKQFMIHEFLKNNDLDTNIRGVMDFSAEVHFSGILASEMWESSYGSLDLRGDSILVYGFNIDRIMHKYMRSQKFTLVDIGAVFLAGPVGIAVTKGSDFARLLVYNKKDSTFIHELLSRWDLKGGELYATDVAFGTSKNRMALQGSINLQNEIYTGLNFAVLNYYGCPVFQQELTGSFDDPEVSNIKIVKTLLGPVKNLFKRDKCKHPFYEGSVRPYEDK